MKKGISIVLSLIILITLIFLTLTLNINILTKYKTIHKVSKKINYIDLVNIKTPQNEIKEKYDSIYLTFQENNISSDLIQKFYDQEFFKKVMTKIIYTESNYLITGDELKTYTEEELNQLSIKSIDKIKNISKEEKNRLIEVSSENTSKILTIENIIRSEINNASYLKIRIIRYILNYKFTVILLCFIIIIIILQYIINKERMLPYIFIPTTICSILELLISLFLPRIVINNLSNKFLENIIYPYIKIFTNDLLFTAITILLISIIYLMMNESIINKMRKVIKPKIKKK